MGAVLSPMPPYIGECAPGPGILAAPAGINAPFGREVICHSGDREGPPLHLMPPVFWRGGAFSFFSTSFHLPNMGHDGSLFIALSLQFSLYAAGPGESVPSAIDLRSEPPQDQPLPAQGSVGCDLASVVGLA